MATIRYKAEIFFEFEKEDYPTPADGNITVQLREELQDAISSSLAVEIDTIKLTKVRQPNDNDPRTQDYD